MIWANRSRKTSKPIKKRICFLQFFIVFPPFMPKEWITPVFLNSITLFLRATASKSLSISLKKRDSSDSLVIWANHYKKNKRSTRNNAFLLYVCTVFPLFMQKERTLPSLLTQLLFSKEWREQFALIALYKRATVSEYFSISFKKRDVSDSLLIQANCSGKTSKSLKKMYFVYVFDSFPPITPVSINSVALF